MRLTQIIPVQNMGSYQAAYKKISRTITSRGLESGAKSHGIEPHQTTMLLVEKTADKNPHRPGFAHASGTAYQETLRTVLPGEHMPEPAHVVTPAPQILFQAGHVGTLVFLGTDSLPLTLLCRLGVGLLTCGADRGSQNECAAEQSQRLR